MWTILTLTLATLMTVSLGQYIKVTNHNSNQAYYLRFTFSNINAAACGKSISGIYVYENSNWRIQDQIENSGADYAWNYNNVRFDQMGDISLRINLNDGTKIFLWGIITTFDSSSTFTSSQLICDGTAAPTPKPTTRSPTKPTVAAPTAPTVCISNIDSDNIGASLEWKSYDNQLYINGNKFNMKGLSWFGFETGNYGLYGLDYHSQDWYLDWMVERGFNAIRLPFSQAYMSSTSNQNTYKAFVQAAGKKGILVMPDFHSKSAGAYTEGFYDLDETTAISTWSTVAALLKGEYNVFMADCFNEPHDISNDNWGTWITFCKKVANAIWDQGANWLIMIEGTNWQCDVISCAWGENLQGARDEPFTYWASKYGYNKFVYSPHVYGADVTYNYDYSEAAWKAHWGYLADGSVSNEAAVVIGEFGTKYDSTHMINWLDNLISYLIEIDQRGHFYWCLNPNSGDTGGLLKDDWTTEQSSKLEALERLQPNPSVISYESSSKICISNLGDTSSSYTGEEEAVNGNKSGVSADVIAIIVICLVAVIAIGVGIAVWRMKKNKHQDTMKNMEEVKDHDEAEEVEEAEVPQDDVEVEVEMITETTN